MPPPLLEPIPISDIFCSGIGAIEAVGTDCLRFYLYVDQRLPEADGQQERIVVAKIVVPRSAISPPMLRVLNGMRAVLQQWEDASGNPLQ